MAIEHCELPHGAFPPATTLPSIAESVAAWANTTWHEIEASAASDRVVTGFCYIVGGALGSSFDGEYDLGVGAAGSEVVKATFRWANRALACNTQQWIGVPVPGAWIAAGDRTAWRARVAPLSGGKQKGLAYTAYSGTPSDAIVTSQRLRVVPATSLGIDVIPSGVAWGNGAWTELVASTSAAWVLAYLTAKNSNNKSTVALELDVGLGAAGSEVVATTVRTSGGPQGLPSICPLGIGFSGIPAATRVAIRCRQDATFTDAWRVVACYQEQPL